MARGFFFRHGWRAALAGEPITKVDLLFGQHQCAGRDNWLEGYEVGAAKRERDKRHGHEGVGMDVERTPAVESREA